MDMVYIDTTIKTEEVIRMLKKECVDEFLFEDELMIKSIKRISKNYSIADFVKVSEAISNYLQNSTTTKMESISGCMYNIREGYLMLDGESVERRLTNEYLDYLLDVLMIEREADKVFYIVAYHYLALMKQLGYQLTSANNARAPFPFYGKEMSPLAKTNYINLYEKMEYGLYGIMNRIYEDDLTLYNKVYRKFGNVHHSTKHFSLIENLEGFVRIVNRMEFDYEFEKVLNLFVFKYRAIYTNEKLHSYMYHEMKR